MLEIAKLNSKTSNNSIGLVAAMLVINIARLAATTLAILIIATLFRLTITTPLKRSACKVAGGRAASNAS
jgi:hypothetical protein